MRICVAAILAGTLLSAITLYARTSGGSQDAAELFRSGTESLQAGRIVEAEEKFRAVTRRDPGSAPAWVNLGVTLMRQKRWTEALAPLRRAEQIDPSMAGIHLNLGLAHFRAREYHEAIPEFRAVLSQAHADPQSRYLLGLSCFFTEDYSCTAEALAPLWQSQSSNLTYLYVLGSAAGRSKQPELETRALRQMAEVGQGSPEFHLYAGKAMLGKLEYGKAIEELRAAIAGQPDLPMAHFFLGQAYEGQHQDEQALQAFTAEIELEPELAYSYDELGSVAVRLGRPAEAEAAFRKAITRDASLSTAFIGLAELYKQQERFAEALRMIDRAVQLQPHSGRVHFLRARLLRQLHKDAEARLEFKQSALLLGKFNDDLQNSKRNAGRIEASQVLSGAQL